MRINIPSNDRKLVQSNTSNAFTDANLVRTWNIDTSTEPGTLRTSPRLAVSTSNSDDADLGRPVAFAVDNNYWAVCGTKMFKTASIDPSAAFAQDALSNSPTVVNEIADMVYFDGKFYVSGENSSFSAGGDMAQLNGATWTSGWWTQTKTQSAMSTSRPHPLGVIRIGSPILAVGDGNKVHTITTGLTVTNSRLTLEAEQRVKWIKSGSTRAYIGCTGTNAKSGLVYEWDGGDTVPTRVYDTHSYGAFAGAVIDDTLYIINGNGEIQVLSGGGFRTVNRFPFSRSQVPIKNASGLSDNEAFIHPNGFIPYKGKLLALVSIQADSASNGLTSVIENNPAGIWEFDPSTNSLTHKYSLTVASDASKDFGQVAIPCDSSTTERAPGALFETAHSKYTTPLLAGGVVWADDATTYKTAIYKLDVTRVLANRGSVTYPRIFTANRQDTLQEVFVAFEKMKSSSDRLVFKYRTEIDPNMPVTAAAVWTSASVFTTTNSGFANVKAGHEIEVIMGNGSGTSAHVSSITEDTGTYTVTLDESITGISASDENYVRATNFLKLASFNDQINTSKTLTVPSKQASPWVQVKVELRSNGGESPVIERCVIITNEHTS